MKTFKRQCEADRKSSSVIARRLGRWRVLPMIGALLFASAAAPAAQPAPTAKTAKPPAKQARPMIDAVIETKAIDLLKAASSRLAATKSMKFTAVISYEAPSRFGPPLVYTTKNEVTMQRPDKLKIVTPGDGPASEFYYDGKVMMAFSPKENLVAVADAPPTVDDMLQYAFHIAEIYYPFSDMLVTDPYVGLANGMQLAFYIGQSSVIDGTTTEMVAFASDDVFAQIWIGADDKLPRRMRAVYRRDPLQLRHEMVLSNWQLDAAVGAAEFASEKAQAATRIKFAHPSTMLPAGTKPAFLRKPATTQPSKPAPAKTK